jgi:hypothetical protein
MVNHVQGGKCRKDRDVTLSPRLLETSRKHWRSPRRKPKVLLFPGNRWHTADPDSARASRSGRNDHLSAPVESPSERGREPAGFAAAVEHGYRAADAAEPVDGRATGEGGRLEARSRELLPTRDVHVVFALPHELTPLALQNKKVIYHLLIRTSAETLPEIARAPGISGPRSASSACYTRGTRSCNIILKHIVRFPPAVWRRTVRTELRHITSSFFTSAS